MSRSAIEGVTDAIEYAIVRRDLQTAFTLLPIVTDTVARQAYQMLILFYMGAYDKAYRLAKILKEHISPRMLSLLKSIYRYRYKSRFRASPKTLSSHTMMAYLFPPLVYASEDEIDRTLQNYSMALDWMLRTPEIKQEIDYQQLVTASFVLSYQGRDISSIQKLKAEAIKRVYGFQSLDPTFDDMLYDTQIISDDRVKIGFITTNWLLGHAVMKDRLGLIRELDRTKFNVFTLHLNTHPPPDLALAMGDCNKIVLTGAHPEVSIISLGLDILFFCDLGMEAYTYRLANLRLAKTQVTTWGHSDTSGCKEIDWYVSSRFFIDRRHFTEPLHIMSGLSTYYFPPTYVDRFTNFDAETRRATGRQLMNGLVDLEPNDFVVVIGSNPIKLHPSFVKTLVCYIQTERNDTRRLRVLLPVSSSPEIANIHAKRIPKLELVPKLDPVMWIALLAAADVYLDTFPFGGCNTIIECFGLGVPFVTFPSGFQYGNFAKGFIEFTQSVQLQSLIVEDDLDYVELIDEFRDTKLTEQLAVELKLQYPKLICHEPSLREYENWLYEVGRSRGLVPFDDIYV